LGAHARRSIYHFRNAPLLVGRVFVKIALIPLDILDHKILASELNMVGEMIDELIIAWKQL
jgi:hypothetical protein